MESVARLARVLCDETRLRLLRELLEGDATVCDLAMRIGLAHPRASSHLRILREAGLVTVHADGRHRAYSANEARLRPLMAALEAAAVPPPTINAPSAHAAREVRRNSPIRQARTCYDHLGGAAGVHLLDAMVERGWLTAEGNRPVYFLTLDGGQALAERGVDLPAPGRRSFAFGCLDWTERRPHLGGALGAAILRTLVAAGFVRRERGTRIVHILRPLDAWLG